LRARCVKRVLTRTHHTATFENKTESADLRESALIRG
jgi:hypothetical protein